MDEPQHICVAVIDMFHKKTKRPTRKRKYKRKITLKGGSKRLLLLLRGEVFRHGNHTRVNGADESYGEQEQASKTHMDLVRKIESRGYTVDILINTYHTKYDDKIRGFYDKKNLKKAIFHTTKFKNQYHQLQNTVQEYKSLNTDYDAIIMARADLYLKPKFIKEYEPDKKTVQLLGILWTKNQRSGTGHLMVNDVFFHFPKQFFHKIDDIFKVPNAEAIFAEHFHQFLEFIPLKFGTEYSLMTKHFYDGNSFDDLNPFYRIIGRAEATTWHNAGRDISELPEFKGIV